MNWPPSPFPPPVRRRTARPPKPRADGRRSAIAVMSCRQDYNDMIYAGSKPEIEAKRKAFIRKWRVKCRAVADSLEEAGDKLFTFTRFPKSQ